MAVVESIAFDADTSEKIKDIKYGENWPVVYIINNDREAYIGETVNASVRASQHFRREERKRLTQISLIGDDKFNKSVILDLETFLINHMAADGKFVLQNSNMGTQPHKYYQQAEYEKGFGAIWNQLKEHNLVVNSIKYIQNSDIFKYSPYKTLNLDQYRVIDAIIQEFADNRFAESGSSIVVNGGAGTGKTVLAVYLMKLLSESNEGIERDSEMDPGYEYIAENLKKLGTMKIGFVVPMQSLRTTIKKVFSNVKHLKKSMVISPIEVPKEKYDLLIVDEAHRLRQRKALSQYPVFDKNNRQLGFDNSGTELDWILKCSRNQVFFYDSMQSVKPSDIDKTKFDELQENSKVLELKSQFRCAGGNDYIKYIKSVLSDNPPEAGRLFPGYDLKIFDDIEEMLSAVKEKDKEHGLCRTVAGYSWKWISKNNKELYDINISGHKYRWNTVNRDWVNSSDSINEIGCIHTIQGYDLNYAGVIFGNEIRFDRVRKEIYIEKSSYYDLQGKTALNKEEDLKEYILNIYKTLMTRGIKGTYVYVCNDELREYLKNYIMQADDSF